MFIPNKPYNNILIDKGTFSPSTTLTSGVDRYNHFKYGWLICYNMNEYNGNYWTQINSASFNPPDKSQFTAIDVDVKSWATTAKSKGVDYAVFTVENEFGFPLRKNRIPFNISSHTLSTGQVAPYWNNQYCINGQADPNIFEKFVSEFRQRGIEPIPYMCFFTHFNLCDGTINNLTGVVLDQTVNYFCRQIQELIVNYKLNYFWMDMVNGTPSAAVAQKLYNAAKSVNPNISIIGNVAGEGGFETYPYDIESSEEYAIYGGNVNYQSTARVHNNTTYYVGQEIVGTPMLNGQWYYFDDYCPVQPNYAKGQFQTVSNYQGIVTNARTYKIPFLADMQVNRQGNLVPEMISFLDQINFT